MYACVYACLYMRMYTCMHAACVCMCVYMYVCMYVCICAFMHAAQYACMYVGVYVCMYVCMYVCAYLSCKQLGVGNNLFYHSVPIKCRSSNSIVGYAVVYILRLIGHTHDRESPIQNFSTAPKKLGAHISSPVWSPKPTEFVPYLVSLRCDALTALKSVQSARNESFLAGSDNFNCVRSAI